MFLKSILVMHKKCLLLILVLISGLAAAQTPESLEMIHKLKQLQLDRLGNPQIKSDAIPPVLSSVEQPHKILVLPVEYADRGFDRFKGEPGAAEKNRRYLKRLLFSENLRKPREETLSHYYFHQSKGRYLVSGEVLPIVKVTQSSAYYGKPIQNSDGQWRNDTQPEQLVEDVLRQAYQENPDFPWQDYDVWDPQDYDGDKVYAEADGYIDHFVLVFAGKGQSSCQRLYSLDQTLTVNVGPEAYEQLEANEKECADRIWPHRFSLSKNNGKGPEVEGFTNRRGGVELKPGLWVYDYNMQSEYTNVSTFIHEFGHSLGLPDIYAMQTSNSTASWEAMSSTASPLPQELSSWSRMVLGWQKPCVVEPTVSGGGRVQSVYLKTMNDWSGEPGSQATESLCDSVMVILPPKIRSLRMGPLQPRHGRQAAYSGQGNDLNHYLSRKLNLSELSQKQVLLEFDAWFSIEADWDYLYVEVSVDGENYQRLMPVDKEGASDTSSVMPSQRGHDGVGTIPGFTGRSGDLDGDGRVESAFGCDPDQARLLAEERIASTEEDPCEQAQWVRAVFDLSAYSGQEVELRFHYFADMAAVEDGALIDNIKIAALNFEEDFESGDFEGWKVDGFSHSGGSHDLAVPHFYLLEYRDPYEKFADAFNYDNSLSEPGFVFYPDLQSAGMKAVDFRYRPGVLMWYYNGSYLWSQNEPSQFGPGNGFLLLVDSTPQEFNLDVAVPAAYYQADDSWRYYEFADKAQPFLRQAFLNVMCFQRRPAYFPSGLSEEDQAYCDEENAALPPGEQIQWNGRQLIYGYTLSNEFLPGKDREPYKSMGTLFDTRLRGGKISYRLYDRLLRNVHSADAPFSLNPFSAGLQFYGLEEGELVKQSSEDFTAVKAFSDENPQRYLNPHLPFGSADIPNAGLGFMLAEPGNNAPPGAKVKVYFTWDR